MSTQDRNQTQDGKQNPGNKQQNPGENQRNQDPTRKGENWQEEE